MSIFIYISLVSLIAYSFILRSDVDKALKEDRERFAAELAKLKAEFDAKMKRLEQIAKKLSK